MTVTSTPPVTTRKPRPPVAARRFGYLVGAFVNAAMLYAVNVWPGWDVLPFLTADTEQVLTAVNATLLTGLVAQVLYLGHDPRWFRALGDVVTTAVGLWSILVVWDVFPFDFGEGFDWAVVARILLVVGIAGSIIGILAALVSFVRAIAAGRQD